VAAERRETEAAQFRAEALDYERRWREYLRSETERQRQAS
jgi:hypothetical protein